MSVIIDFSYSWWNSQYGFRFNKEIYQNADKRVAQIKSMYEKLCRRFLWYSSYMPAPPSFMVEPYGHRFIPALFGCEIAYGDDVAPWAENNILTPDEIMAMPMWTMEDFLQDPHRQVVHEQVTYARKKHGWCTARQNLGGVMNAAIYLRGMDLFEDFYERPELVHKLMSLIANKMELAYEYGTQMDGAAADTGVGNCSVCMVSPKIYDEFVYPYDRVMMELAKKNNVRFGIHHDSNGTPYLDSYRRFEYLHHFDLGFETDIARYREAFPEAVLDIYLYTSFMLERTPEEIKTDVARLAALSGNKALTQFTCLDIDENISDDKVTALYEAVINL